MPLIELAIAMALVAMVALWSSQTIINDADDLLATSTGVYLANVASAAERHLLTHYQALANSQPIAGVANPLRPTIAELSGPPHNRLPGSFPQRTPTGQAVGIFINPTSCPGPACLITATVCTQEPLGTRGQARSDLATVAMAQARGMGARSHDDVPGVVRGPTVAPMTNPVGSVGGIVCAQSNVDAGIYENFVRQRDTRRVELLGGLAMLDPANPNNVCVEILNEGRININCQGQLHAALGVLTGPMGSARIGDTGNDFVVDATGRIRGTAGFWSAMGSVFGDNTLGVRAAGTEFTIQTSAGTHALAVHDAGRVGAATSLATPAIGLTDPVTLGTACNAAAQVGATLATPTAATTVLRAAVGGGLAVCTNGVWSNVTPGGTLGGTCSPSGAMATASDGRSLYCSGGTWALTSDRFGYMVAAESWTVSHNQTVPKPQCAAGSTGARIYLQDANTPQKVQNVNRQVVDLGNSWRIRHTDGQGLDIAGTLVVTSYCLYQ